MAQEAARSQTIDLLTQGGLELPARGRGTDGAEATERRDGTLKKYVPFLDPQGAETLAIQLAAKARAVTPSIVVIWEDTEDAVLAHVAARELSVPIVRAWDADGLVALSGARIMSGARALIVTDAVRDAAPFLAVRASVEQAEGRVVAMAVLVATREADAVGTTVLSLVDA